MRKFESGRRSCFLLHAQRSGAVVCSTVRRALVTVLVGLIGLVLGATIGFVVSQRQKLHDSGWVEAVGTWVGAGVTLLAVILGAIAYFSEEFARSRDRRRQEAVDRAEAQRLQVEADQVFCDISVEGTPIEAQPGRVAVDAIVIEVDNRSIDVVTDVICEVKSRSFPWSGWIDEPIESRTTGIESFPSSQQLDVSDAVNTRNLRGSAVFTFSLLGYRWSRRYGQTPAVRKMPVSEWQVFAPPREI